MKLSDWLSEARWKKGGQPIMAADGSLVCGCLVDCVRHCYGDYSGGRLMPVLKKLRWHVPRQFNLCIVAFNDHPNTTYAMVRAVVLAAGV